MLKVFEISTKFYCMNAVLECFHYTNNYGMSKTSYRSVKFYELTLRPVTLTNIKVLIIAM